MSELKLFAHMVNTTNGPGKRLTLYFKGCSLTCPACIYKDTNDKSDTQISISIDGAMELIHSEIISSQITGLSLSGGEPFNQKNVMYQLLRRVRKETNLDVLVYTGLFPRELGKLRDHSYKELVDVILSGRFDQNLFSQNKPLNHKEILLFSDRYTKKDIEDSYRLGAELVIDMNTGTYEISGVNSLMSSLGRKQ